MLTNGSLRTITYPANGQVVYENYDYRGLMTWFYDQGGDSDASWVYDIVNLPTTACPGNAMSVFTWDVNDHLGRIRHYDNSTKVLDTSFGYDAAGNRTTDGTFTYVWDAENRLTEVYPTSPSQGSKKLVFTYDYMGRRAGIKAREPVSR